MGFVDISVCESALRRAKKFTCPVGNSSQKAFPKVRI
jgi:hypothetical protein